MGTVSGRERLERAYAPYDGPYRDGTVHVCIERCSTCVFLPGNVMSLRPGVLKSMVEGSTAQGGVIPCHQTLSYYNHGPGGRKPPAVCHRFFSVAWERVEALRAAVERDRITFDAT